MKGQDARPIRWIEIGLPDAEHPEHLLFLKADGPFALRKWYHDPRGGDEIHLHLERRTESGGLSGCLHCGHPELFQRKRFPRRLGLAIVVLAAIAAPFTMYASLAVAAVLDFVIYHSAPDEVVCYVCGAVHRGFRGDPRHPRYDRTIAERLSYGEAAVMGSPMREGGTAGAPDPEH